MCRVGQPSKTSKSVESSRRRVCGTRQGSFFSSGLREASGDVQFQWAAKGPIRHLNLAVEITESFYSPMIMH